MMMYSSCSLIAIIAAARIGTIAGRLHGYHGGADQQLDEITVSSEAKVQSIHLQHTTNNADEEPPLSIPAEHGGESLIAMQFTPDPHAHRDRMEMILNGELGLAAIRYAPNSFGDDEEDERYADVHAEFCVHDPTLNKSDPAKYSTINSIMSESEHCGEHRYQLPLSKVMEAVHTYDTSSDGRMKMKQLPVSGMLFHEGYCGAGLLSNALSTFDSTLVISEHAALRDALNACDTIRNRYKIEDCSIAKQEQLVQDVVTLLSRTSRSDKSSNIDKLYLKLSSASSAYLPTLTQLYPSAKWTFVYRNNEHALAKSTQHKRSKTCIKSKRNPSSALVSKSSEYNVNLEQLTTHEVCALHLSSLMDAAITEHNTSGKGLLLSYDKDIVSNVDSIVNVILPYFDLQTEIKMNPQGVRDNVSQILSTKSNVNGMVNDADRQWRGENIDVSEEVVRASALFMKDSMGHTSL